MKVNVSFVKGLTVAVSVYGTISLYGILRGADIEVLRSIAVCFTYGVGFYTIIMLTARDLLGLKS